MNYSTYRVALDVHKVSSSVTLKAKRGNTGRMLCISLVDGGLPYAISEDCFAVFVAKKPDGKLVRNDCIIDNNTIIYKFTEQTVAAEGIVACEIELYGADMKLITSPKFTILVSGTVYNEGDEIESEDESNSLVLATRKYVHETIRKITTDGVIVSGADSIVCVASGDVISVSDASNRLLNGMKIYGKTTQDGTPTPDAPVELVTAGVGGSITVSVEQTGQSLVLATPNGFLGIPMEDSCTTHNFVDETGKKWLTDEIDFARGVYIQRCFVVTFDGSENWEGESTKSVIGETTFPAMKGALNDNNQCYHLCSHFRSVARRYGESNGRVTMYGSTRGATLAFVHNDLTGLETWKAYLSAQATAGTPMTIVLCFKNPVETALSAEELEAYADLHTSKPNTTISNDASAPMEVEYIADTKAYIDNKFNALAAALVNNT